MNNIWRSTQYTNNTKLKLYQSCVVPTLLYRSECWKITEKDLSKLRSFYSTCLRRILRIFWPGKITNEDLKKMHARGHGHYHYQTPMEIDRTCPTKTSPVYNKNSTTLDPRRQEEEREAKNIMEKNS
jgi:hypothetical protein